MAKSKRKLTGAEKAAKARRRAQFTIVFINGRQKRLARPALIDGLDPDEFILRNADPVWLHQNEEWERMPESAPSDIDSTDADDVPF